MEIVRLAMVGGGRAAQSLHLPAASLCSNLETSVIVDRDLQRAQSLAQAYDVPEARASVTEAANLADAAVVALPHHLHAPVTKELLEAGLHVLVEKPLALTGDQCDELALLARQRGLVLAVGMIRRSFPAARFVKRALDSEMLGRLRSVSVWEGMPFAWEVASDFTFREETGGGVLADTGVHLLDLLSWWLGDLEPVAYRDDAAGGVEANAEIELEHAPGVPVTLELSRTRLQSNCIRIEGDRGVLEAGSGFDAQVRLDLGTVPLVGEAKVPQQNYQNVRELFVEQLGDFVSAIRNGGEPQVGPEEAAVGVKLLERCRELRVPLNLPWVEIQSGVSA